MRYEYTYSGEIADMEEMLPALIGSLLIPILAGIATATAIYIIRSLSMYTLAKRRRISHAWTAWVPVASGWMQGCISDQYQFRAKGRNKKRRNVMLTLRILNLLFAIPMIAAYSKAIIMAIPAVLTENEAMMDQVAVEMAPYMLVAMACLLPAIGLEIAHAVFYLMTLFDYYASCSPREATLYLLLGIFFNIAEPIFMFICRNKDEGMPFRQESVPNPSPELPQ